MRTQAAYDSSLAFVHGFLDVAQVAWLAQFLDFLFDAVYYVGAGLRGVAFLEVVVAEHVEESPLLLEEAFYPDVCHGRDAFGLFAGYDFAEFAYL